MKWKQYVIIFVTALALGLGVISGCAIGDGLGGTVVITNFVGNPVYVTNVVGVVEIGTYTNLAIITNHVTITNNGYVIQGNITITNNFNEATVQPTFLLAGSIDGDLVNFVTNITLKVTNSGYSTNGSVYSSGGERLWKAVAYSQSAYPYIYVRVEAELVGIGYYFMSLNFFVSNIPQYQFTQDYDGTVTNSSTISLDGDAYVTLPDYINKVYIYRVNESWVTNITDCSLMPGTAWTNTVTNSQWSEVFSLDNGDNTFFGYVVSSAGVTNSLSSFVITRSIIGVDGIKDPLWASAPVVGESTIAGFNGYRLGEMLITNDNYNLFFWVDAVNVPKPSSLWDGPRISIAIDTNNADGVTNDSWGGSFVFQFTNSQYPDYQLQFRLQDGGGQAMYRAKYNAGTFEWENVAYNWSGGDMKGIRMAGSYTNGFEISVPLSLLGLTAGNTIRCLTVLSGEENTGQSCQAWDVIPESPLNGWVTNENQFDTVEQVYCTPYVLD